MQRGLKPRSGTAVAACGRFQVAAYMSGSTEAPNDF